MEAFFPRSRKRKKKTEKKEEERNTYACVHLGIDEGSTQFSDRQAESIVYRCKEKRNGKKKKRKKKETTLARQSRILLNELFSSNNTDNRHVVNDLSSD